MGIIQLQKTRNDLEELKKQKEQQQQVQQDKEQKIEEHGHSLDQNKVQDNQLQRGQVLDHKHQHPSEQNSKHHSLQKECKESKQQYHKKHGEGSLGETVSLGERSSINPEVNRVRIFDQKQSNLNFNAEIDDLTKEKENGSEPEFQLPLVVEESGQVVQTDEADGTLTCHGEGRGSKTQEVQEVDGQIDQDGGKHKDLWSELEVQIHDVKVHLVSSTVSPPQEEPSTKEMETLEDTYPDSVTKDGHKKTSNPFKFFSKGKKIDSEPTSYCDDFISDEVSDVYKFTSSSDESEVNVGPNSKPKRKIGNKRKVNATQKNSKAFESFDKKEYKCIDKQGKRRKLERTEVRPKLTYRQLILQERKEVKNRKKSTKQKGLAKHDKNTVHKPSLTFRQMILLEKKTNSKMIDFEEKEIDKIHSKNINELHKKDTISTSSDKKIIEKMDSMNTEKIQRKPKTETYQEGTKIKCRPMVKNENKLRVENYSSESRQDSDSENATNQSNDEATEGKNTFTNDASYDSQGRSSSIENNESAIIQKNQISESKLVFHINDVINGRVKNDGALSEQTNIPSKNLSKTNDDNLELKDKTSTQESTSLNTETELKKAKTFSTKNLEQQNNFENKLVEPKMEVDTELDSEDTVSYSEEWEDLDLNEYQTQQLIDENESVNETGNVEDDKAMKLQSECNAIRQDSDFQLYLQSRKWVQHVSQSGQLILISGDEYENLRNKTSSPSTGDLGTSSQTASPMTWEENNYSKDIVTLCYFCLSETVFFDGSMDDFRKHLMEHLKDYSPSECPLDCNQNFGSTVNDMAIHFFEEHQCLPSVHCSLCQKTFVLDADLMSHICEAK